MLTAETVEFVDTHVHFWDQGYPGLRYEWLRRGGDPEETAVLGEYGAIRTERYLPDDFRREVRTVIPSAVVHVQAALGSDDPVLESRWLDKIRVSTGIPSAFIGDGRLNIRSFSGSLEGHRNYSGFRGIRDLGLSRYIDDPVCAENVTTMEKAELILCDADALSRIDQTVDLIGSHDNGLTYCIDHTLMPLRRDAEYFEVWRAGLRRLADLPHAVMKISGLGQVDHDWTVASLKPWIMECFEVFGISRCFFGTNWPVDRLYSSYRDLVEAYVTVCAELSDEEGKAVLSGNARRIFNISDTRRGL